MNKAVMISIQPKWCELIANGKKTIEVRKTRPKLETPFKCYVYCTKPKTTNPHEYLYKRSYEGYTYPYNGKVFAEFVCDSIIYLGNIATDSWEYLSGSTHTAHKHLVTYNACMTESECLEYGGEYAWHISDLVIYDNPKALSEFNYWPYKDCGIECSKCKYGIETNELLTDGYICDREMKRPPQSWCYVEEVSI